MGTSLCVAYTSPLFFFLQTNVLNNLKYRYWILYITLFKISALYFKLPNLVHTSLILNVCIISTSSIFLCIYLHYSPPLSRIAVIEGCWGGDRWWPIVVMWQPSMNLKVARRGWWHSNKKHISSPCCCYCCWSCWCCQMACHKTLITPKYIN